MAAVSVSAATEPLDALTDALGQFVNVRLSRPALDRLDVEIEGATYPLVRLRVEAKLRELGVADAELRYPRRTQPCRTAQKWGVYEVV
jgi:hypothetical protein